MRSCETCRIAFCTYFDGAVLFWSVEKVKSGFLPLFQASHQTRSTPSHQDTYYSYGMNLLSGFEAGMFGAHISARA
jgi:hypothetical protein